MPAALLVVLLLGAVATDAALVYLRQRQAWNIAFDAANDAASAGIDLATIRSTGEIVYDPDRVRELAAATIAASDQDVTLVSATATGTTVEVTVETRVDHVLSPGRHGDAETVRVTARVDGVRVGG